ncbi:hypothetical protein HNW13_017575 [Shewanella sp. BF02_Schw]|uniref:hypothetical protein n=1 Tax=Shewanella sp. BF02_Schw TaxID=394908 RepID=UPI001783AF32|nr:hypothetical protein [Shewanella sp. BF02_Schw]MBO1897550.1 hypothetical protein [Shewanella sp. BF02_Schw]
MNSLQLTDCPNAAIQAGLKSGSANESQYVCSITLNKVPIAAIAFNADAGNDYHQAEHSICVTHFNMHLSESVLPSNNVLLAQCKELFSLWLTKKLIEDATVSAPIGFNSTDKHYYHFGVYSDLDCSLNSILAGVDTDLLLSEISALGYNPHEPTH